MSKLLIKQISILSGIFGALFGVLSLIPVIRNIAFLAVILFIAPIIIIYFKKFNILQEVSNQWGMIIGTISGIISIIAFMLSFTPLDLLLSLFIKDGYIAWIASFIKNAGFFNYIMILFFLCILNGITNAFSGLTTAYVYDFLKNVKE